MSPIGYEHNAVANEQILGQERAQIWHDFESLRKQLYAVYIDFISTHETLGNLTLAKCLREDIYWQETNKTREDNKAQWRDIIDRYSTDKRHAELNELLLKILE